MSDTEQHPSGDLVFHIGDREVHRVQPNMQTTDLRFLNTAMSVHGATHVLLPPSPPMVGHWILEQCRGVTTSFVMHRRPRWLTRWAMRVVFDIHWRDA